MYILYVCFLQAHVHHYTTVAGMEQSAFDESLESLTSVIQEYTDLDKHMSAAPDPVPRLQIVS